MGVRGILSLPAVLGEKTSCVQQFSIRWFIACQQLGPLKLFGVVQLDGGSND